MALISGQAVACRDGAELEHDRADSIAVATATRAGVPSNRRVLLVAPQPFYQDRGTPIAVRQVLEGLSQLGYMVDLLTYPVGADIRLPRLRTFRTPNPFGIKTVPVGLSVQKLILDVPLTLGIRERLAQGTYTCIHAVEEAAFPAVLLGRRYKVPVVYDMQSSLPEQLVTHRGLRSTPVRYLLEKLEAWLLGRADFVVSSAGLAERVRRIAPGCRVREWQYASAIVPAESINAGRLRRQLAIPAQAPVVLYGGTFESYQGLAQLLQAVPMVRAQVPDAMFVLVGAENGNGMAVRQQAAPLVKAGSVKIVDRQPRHEIPSYLGMADVLVSPRSHGGNLPLKILDYLAAGRPIVATDIPTHRTVLNEERAVLVSTRTEALAAGIVRLLRDPELAEGMAQEARRYADTYLGWNGFVESLSNLYEDVHRHASAPV